MPMLMTLRRSLLLTTRTHMADDSIDRFRDSRSIDADSVQQRKRRDRQLLKVVLRTTGVLSLATSAILTETSHSLLAQPIPAARGGAYFDVVYESFERASLVVEPTEDPMLETVGQTTSDYNALICDSFERAGMTAGGSAEVCD